MFDNIGRRLKTLAQILLALSVIGTVYGAVFAAITVGEAADSVLAGIGVFIGVGGVGILVSWVGAMVLYGLGQMMLDASYARVGVNENEIAIKTLREMIEAKSDPSENMHQTGAERSMAEAKETPAEKKEEPFENRNREPEGRSRMKEIATFAGKYSTDSGMTEYLRGEMKKLSEEDRSEVEQLLKLPPNEMREAMKKITEQA